MIKIEDVEVIGMRKAIKGMRNAMNSWDKSDSYFQLQCSQYAGCEETEDCNHIGEKDMELAKRLIKAGSSDRKFMRMIHVQADVTAPLYYWKEFSTYKVGTTANSCSTMHTIHKREFTMDDFSHEHLFNDGYITHGEYCYLSSMDCLKEQVHTLNMFREKYLETKDKKYWWQMIQLLPSSYNQMRTIDLDYETLFSIYHQRKNHKLNEWVTFCEWIETLPYMKEFLNIN